MRKRVPTVVLLGALMVATAAPVAANGASVERLANIQTVLAVRMDADFPLASLMRATCTSLIRIERPDGSSTEIQDCHLSDEPVIYPAFQARRPPGFILEAGRACGTPTTGSPFAGLDVLAERVRLTVTPSGHVHATSEYPAVPLACD